MKPLAIDLFCGLGGWSEGLLAEQYDCVGFDIEHHQYGAHRYPAQLVVQDVLTLHGSQFRDATLIVASPPCQSYSWMAMPWKLAKAKAAAIRADTTGKMLADLNRLFDACFRIQAQASMAAGRHIPMVVENVRGAQPWVGRARWNFGSFYLWGDVPALMPWTFDRRMKHANQHAHGHPSGNFHHPEADAAWRKNAGPNWREMHAAVAAGGKSGHWTNPTENGLKCGGDWFNDSQPSISRMTSSRSPARKAASAMIARIPLPLARHIAAVYRSCP
jgi:hypothetical protein